MKMINIEDRNKSLEKDFWKIVKDLFILNSIIALIGFIILELLYNSEGRPFIMGILFGTIITFLNFRLLYLSLKKAMKMKSLRAQISVSSGYILRFFIMAIVIYGSYLAEHINVIGTIIGLLTLKFIIYKNHLFDDMTFFKNVFKKK